MLPSFTFTIPTLKIDIKIIITIKKADIKTVIKLTPSK